MAPPADSLAGSPSRSAAVSRTTESRGCSIATASRTERALRRASGGLWSNRRWKREGQWESREQRRGRSSRGWSGGDRGVDRLGETEYILILKKNGRPSPATPGKEHHESLSSLYRLLCSAARHTRHCAGRPGRPRTGAGCRRLHAIQSLRGELGVGAVVSASHVRHRRDEHLHGTGDVCGRSNDLVFLQQLIVLVQRDGRLLQWRRRGLCQVRVDHDLLRRLLHGAAIQVHPGSSMHSRMRHVCRGVL